MTPRDTIEIDGRTPFAGPLKVQLAALCRRKGKSGPEVLMVTSSNGRWILPKGWPMEGVKDWNAALVEAWEEGGVKKARVSKKPLGSYISTKISAFGDEEPCLTWVYGARVTKMSKDYPEAGRRDRRWIPLREAARLVTEDGLREILKRL